MSDPAMVRVEGPLAGLVPGFRDSLNAAGYSPGSAAHQLQLIARLSRWMVGRSLSVEGLTPMVIDDLCEASHKSQPYDLGEMALSKSFLTACNGAIFISPKSYA